jgi:hypothetical protein
MSSGSDCAWVDYISVPKNVPHGVPYIDTDSVNIVTDIATGDTIITILNVGNAPLNFNATVENEESNSWLSLSNNSGTLAPNQKTDIILLYDLTFFAKQVFETHVLIEVLDTVFSIPVSITYLKEEEEEYGIPYITPDSIDLQIEKPIGDCTITMQNIGTKFFEYSITIEPEDSCEWLFLSNNSGILEVGEAVEIIVSYDFSLFEHGNYNATLNIDVIDSVITVPLNIKYILSITYHEAKNFRIYPNPATNDIHVIIPNFTGVACIDVFTFTGQKIHTGNILEQSNTFSISHLGITGAGVYFIRIKTDRFVETLRLTVF